MVICYNIHGDTMHMTIGSRIKKIRNDKKLPQKAVADLLGLHRTNYSKVENDVQKLTPEQIKLFCEYFNVSADYLLDIKANNKMTYNLDTIEEADRMIRELSDLLKQK